MSRLRAGIVGLGTMGRHHARVLGSLPGVELVGATDPDPLAQAAACGIPVSADLDDLLATGLDMCVVATPTLTHSTIGLRLAEAGVPTLIEKPLAADPASGRQLATEFGARGLVGCVGHVERYNSAARALRARLAQGELGTVFQVATRRQGPFPPRIRDVGVIMDLATHDIDLTQWVTGSRYMRVAAFTSCPSGRLHEDMVIVSGMLRDGTVTNHLVNWVSAMKERVFTVTGERGCLIASTLATELWFQRNGSVTARRRPGTHPFRGASEGDLIRFSITKREALTAELENFRDAILGKPAEIVTMRQGTETLEVAAAVQAASDAAASSIGITAGELMLPRQPEPELAGAPGAIS